MRLLKKHGNGLQRCGQPGQQHGLRIPPRILSRPTSMRRFLVSSFLAEVTQQIHSFRASGVIAAQRPFAAASHSMALRKSAGSLWSVPPVTALVVMRQLRSVACRLTSALSRREPAVRKRRGRRLSKLACGALQTLIIWRLERFVRCHDFLDLIDFFSKRNVRVISGRITCTKESSVQRVEDVFIACNGNGVEKQPGGKARVRDIPLLRRERHLLFKGVRRLQNRNNLEVRVSVWQ